VARPRIVGGLIALATLAVLAGPWCARADERPIGQMRWRIVGPALPEGRATSVVGSNARPLLYYAGTAGGGVWKTIDGGASWQNISDAIAVASVGAIAIESGDDQALWVGAGETNPRNDVIPESGLYRSRNGGRSWEAVGFPRSAGISRILIDPKNPKHVVVGVLGDPFAQSQERGVFVSFDGGGTFVKSLYLSPQSGASDVAMDPGDPNLLLAGMWHVSRRPWQLTSGGQDDDGLFRSADGGKSWSKVTGNGFPKPPLGRIGVAFAPSQPSRIYALVESRDGVLWRSDDAGVTWKLTSKDTVANQRPFYFSHVGVSPTDPNTVYGVSMLLATSYDGGTKFNLSAFGVHSDLHELWISAEGDRMALAGDGGIAISTNRGATWTNARDMPVGQVYRVGVSNTVPYLVCGGLQDNNAYCGPAFSGNADGITNRDWFKVVEGDGEWAVPDPSDSRSIWADSQNGEIQIFDRRSHEAVNVRPYRGSAEDDFVLARSRYRFNWQSPIAFAAYDPHLAFIGANVLFATRDRGRHWQVISPDLTRNDRTKQQVAQNSVTQDESGAENYGTLLDIGTSPFHKSAIWTGSDDGLVHLTLDGGKHWRDVTPPDLPPDSAIESVSPSTLVDGTAFVSADRHGMGDPRAYIDVTRDFGAHWQRVTAGIPPGEYVRTVRPDIRNPNLVYAGTNRGIYISCDGGKAWQSFQNNLPVVEVRDIRFQPRFDDMVIATHGRAIWVMDDMRVAQVAGCAKPAGDLVIGPRPSIALSQYRDDEGNYNDFVASQPNGGFLTGGGGPVAKVYYWLAQEAPHRPTVDVYDRAGHRVRHIEGEHDVFTGSDSTSYWLSNSEGKNEFSYDFTIDGPVRYESAPFFFRGPNEGPQLPPGRYTLAFHLDGKSYRFPIEQLPDPQSSTTQREYDLQFAQRKRVYDLLGRIDVMLNQLHNAREQLAGEKNAIKAADVMTASKVQAMIDSIDATLASLTSSPTNFEDSIQKPGQLREDVMGLTEAEPLAQASLELYARLERAYGLRAVAYDDWVRNVAQWNAALKSAGLKTIAVPSALVELTKARER
jgi:photosystem II stability/assembly factor-like uncharacterized protein